MLSTRERDDLAPRRRVADAPVERVRPVLGEADDVGRGSQPGSWPRSPAMPVPTSTTPSQAEQAGVEAALEQVEGQRPRRDEEDEDPDRPVIERGSAACCGGGSSARCRARCRARRYRHSTVCHAGCSVYLSRARPWRIDHGPASITHDPVGAGADELRGRGWRRRPCARRRQLRAAVAASSSRRPGRATRSARPSAAPADRRPAPGRWPPAAPRRPTARAACAAARSPDAELVAAARAPARSASAARRAVHVHRRQPDVVQRRQCANR